MEEKIKDEMLDLFGNKLIYEVRDYYLDQFNNSIIKEAYTDEKKIFKQKYESLGLEGQEFLKKVVTEAVDSTLHYFLWMIEQDEEYDLVRYSKEDKSESVSLRDISDGLCGELYTEDGWIERFSKYPPSIK